MNQEQQFPILGEKTGPRSVAWSLVEPHRRQAMKNHDQTLERLAERGGLCASEMCAVLEDRAWAKMETKGAIARLEMLVAEHQRLADKA